MGIFETGRTMFLEEWFLSSLGLAVLFFAVYGGILLKKRAARRTHSKKPAPAKPSTPPESAPTEHATQRERPDPDKEQMELLQKALEEILSGDENAVLPRPPENTTLEALAQVKESFKELDSFGLTFQKMQVFNDPNASLQKLSQAIMADIVFSSKVLKQANSPYFGMPGQVSSLHHAVLILGINNLKTLYFQDHFKMVGKEGGHLAIIRQNVWRHSIVTAIFSAHLCKAFRIVPPETAFTLGLLHDIGKLVLADIAERMADNEESPLDYSSSWTVDQERSLFGVEHAAIGRFAASTWNLPKETAVVIGAHHHMQLDADATSDMAKAQLMTLAVADSLAHAWCNEPIPLLPTSLTEKLHNKKRMLQLLQDKSLHEELNLTHTMG